MITPGGGIEEGETPEEAAIRELDEEVGFDGLELGPVVWRRRDIFRFNGNDYDQSETFFLVRAPSRFEPTPKLSAEELRRESIYGIRWWVTEELDGKLTAPADMPDRIRRILKDGPPAEPILVGR